MNKKPTTADIENIESKILKSYGNEYFSIIKDLFNIYEQNLHNKDPNMVICIDNELNYESLDKKISRANNLYNIIYEISSDRNEFQIEENNIINTLIDARASYIKQTTGKFPDDIERITPGEIIEKIGYFRDSLKDKKPGEVISYEMLDAVNTQKYVPKFFSGLKGIIAKLFK